MTAAPTLGGGRGRPTESPHRLSVVGRFHLAVRHRQGERLLRQSRPRRRVHSDAHGDRAPGGLERQYQFLYLAPVGHFRGGIRPSSGGRLVAVQGHALGVGDRARRFTGAKDLIGKKIAISDIRSSPYYFARAGFKKLGLDDKQVTLATTGGTSNSFAALTSNQVAGAVLSPPFDDKAVSLGYKKFLFLGDLADIPYVGLFTSQAEIRTHRERVRKTIAAVMDAVAWQRANRGEAVRMIAARYKISLSEAEHSYETMTGILSPDGSIDLKKVRGYLALLREERPHTGNARTGETGGFLHVAIGALVCFHYSMRTVIQSSRKLARFLHRHRPCIRRKRGPWRRRSARRNFQGANEGAPGGKSKSVAAPGAN